MDTERLVDLLTQAFLGALGVATESISSLGAEERAQFEQLSATVRDRAKRLLRDAYSAGLPEHLTVDDIGATGLSGGMTADSVFRVASELRFVVKVDNSPKLVEEARKLIRLTSSGDVPAQIAKLFPRVYSAVFDIPPYAYLMESFSTPPYTRFSDMLLGSAGVATDAAVRVIQALLDWYEWSIDGNLIPNLVNLYEQRIVERVTAAAAQDARFGMALANGIVLNGQQYNAPTAYAEILRPRLQSLAPQFVTAIHGDAHPGNIFISDTAVRFIDVKEWPAGDYVWDVGKLLHYVLVTSAAEDQSSPPTVDAHVDGDRLVLKYQLQSGETSLGVASTILDSVGNFAKEHGDNGWRERLQLSIAANLLGLPPARLRKGSETAALIFLGEGIRWLADVASDRGDGIVRRLN